MFDEILEVYTEDSWNDVVVLQVVLPGGNTSFDVVFLGREEGLIENTIFIHTSIGTYKYGVSHSVLGYSCSTVRK